MRGIYFFITRGNLFVLGLHISWIHMLDSRILWKSYKIVVQNLTVIQLEFRGRFLLVLTVLVRRFRSDPGVFQPEILGFLSQAWTVQKQPDVDAPGIQHVWVNYNELTTSEPWKS